MGEKLDMVHLLFTARNLIMKTISEKVHCLANSARNSLGYRPRKGRRIRQLLSEGEFPPVS